MSEFKVGDWVRNTWLGTVKQYSYSDRAYDDKYNGTENESKHWELWEPQVGEWCWFLSNSRLSSLELLNFSGTYLDDEDYRNYEPFIGNLPNFIKKEIG